MNVEVFEPSASASLAAFVRSDFSRITSELQEFVRIPSVSGDLKHTSDVKRCAGWLARQLRNAGLERVRVFSTPRHPIVYGEWLNAPGKATVLIYGHYDVQPAEPLKDWRLPAFRGENTGERMNH